MEKQSRHKSEKYLERKLVSEVNRIGGIALKFPATHFTGIPDRLCLFPGGIVVFVEMKSYGKKPTKIQSGVHQRLRRLGFKVLVIDSMESIKKFIRDHEN